MNKYTRYLKKLLTHKYYVYKASRRLKVPILRGIFHDSSKFLPIEFLPYARYNFGGENTEKQQFEFDRAWLHHQNVNPHHWQWWILINDEDGTYCLDIPETYIREMCADWMGASKAYMNSWDMVDWLTKNLYKIELSDNTRDILYEILEEIGYSIHSVVSEKETELLKRVNTTLSYIEVTTREKDHE